MSHPISATTTSQTRAELLRYVTAYFHASGALAVFAALCQVIAIALAASGPLRDALEPSTKILILALAGLIPFVRSWADRHKRLADEILRRIETSDGLGNLIRAIEFEDVREGAPFLIGLVARRIPLSLEPYASKTTAGPRRLIENTRETAWWSKRLSCELARWQSYWAMLLVVVCFGTLYQLSVGHSALRDAASNQLGSRDATEFAAGLLVFVLFEGSLRRAMEFKEFERESQKAIERAEQTLARLSDLDVVAATQEALLLKTEYSLARSVAPRLSSIWYNIRKRELNAAWARVHNEDVDL